MSFAIDTLREWPTHPITGGDRVRSGYTRARCRRSWGWFGRRVDAGGDGRDAASAFPRARVHRDGRRRAVRRRRADATPIVLADVAALERVRTLGAGEGTVVALTREMGPATLLRAETLGVAASLRPSTTAEHLQAVRGADARSDLKTKAKGTAPSPRPNPAGSRPMPPSPRSRQRLGAPGEIALDTEGDSLHHYPERLALIQLAVRRRRVAGRSAGARRSRAARARVRRPSA